MHVDEQLSDGNGLGVERIYDFSTVNRVVNFRWFINLPTKDRQGGKSFEIHVTGEFYFAIFTMHIIFAHAQSLSIIFYGNINEHEPSKDNKTFRKTLGITETIDKE